MRALCRSAVLVAALGAALAPGATAHAGGAATEVGPKPRSAPVGATVVEGFAALDAMVRDPQGPTEIWLAPGTYQGDLEIRRPLALRGAGGVVLEGTGTGTVVHVEADDVTVENVAIRHSGHRHTAEDAGLKAKGNRVRVVDVSIDDALFGAELLECHHCLLERVRVVGPEGDHELRGDGVKLWEANDSIVRDCVVEHARDVVVWYTRRALLERNTVRHGRYGTHFMYAHDGIVRQSHVEDNVVGIFVMYSMRLTVENNVLAGARGAAGVGIGFKDSDAVTVKGNWFVANTTGTYLDSTPRTADQPVHFDGNVFALNEVALRFHMAEEGLHLAGNDFRQNAVMVEVDGGGDALAADVRGNHYSDYEGYDLDGNGVGDVAFEVKALSSELTERHPSLKFFYGTTALASMDAVARAVPVLASKKLLVDPAPLVRAPEVPLP
jgi:nitrous oxidase accessory protein